MKFFYRLLLLCLFGSGAVCAQTTPYVVDPSSCEKPDYPSASKRLMEEGTVQLRFLVGVDGKVIESVVEKSSGFRRLDEAARDGLSKCTFKPSVKEGQIVQGLTRMRYTWMLEVSAPCSGSDASKWRSCLGTLTTPTGGLLVVEYNEAGKKNGRGIEYDGARNVIRAGIFEGENLVSGRNLDKKLYPFVSQLPSNSANQSVNLSALQPNISSSNLPPCIGDFIQSDWSYCRGKFDWGSYTYTGEFLKNRPHGRGVKMKTDGTLLADGIWHEGQLRIDLTADIKQ